MTIYIFGEAMLEYHSGGALGGLRYGGDTLNTAIHMARMGMDVAYVTAVGSDPISDALIDLWQAEGIDTRYVMRHPGRNPGIYAIHVDDTGERSFLYWRSDSAASDMFSLPQIDEACEAASKADLLYYSLISLAILPPAARGKLYKTAKAVKAGGGVVAYDSNFRSNLWASHNGARQVSNEAIALSTIGLPTNTDESELHGVKLAEEDIADLWHNAGCNEVIVKAGAKGCFASSAPHTAELVPAKAMRLVDASGAGDAFNAGYLASRLSGKDIHASIARGQQVASWVITRKGAVPPQDEDAPY